MNESRIAPMSAEELVKAGRRCAAGLCERCAFKALDEDSCYNALKIALADKLEKIHERLTKLLDEERD